MSLVGMRKKMHGPTTKYIMIGLSIIFAAAAFVGFSSYKNDNGGSSGAVAKVDGQKIDTAKFDTETANRISQEEKQSGGQQLPAFQKGMLRGKLFDDMIDSAVRTEAAKKEGVRVSRGELKKQIDDIVKQQMNIYKQNFLGSAKDDKNDRLFKDALQKQGLTISEVRAEILKNIDKDDIRSKMMFQKLYDKWKEEVDVSDKAFKASYDELMLSQITIGIRTRSDAQAKQQAEELAKKLQAGGDFAAAAKQYSVDPFKARGGKRDSAMPRAYMDPTLTSAVSNLKEGQVSDPVKMDLGYTIFKLDSKQSVFPPDFNNKDKQKQYWDQFKQTQQNQVISKKLEDIKKAAKVVIYDPELKGYRLMMDMFSSANLSPAERKAKALEAVGYFKKAAVNDAGDSATNARAYSEMAYLLFQMSRPEMGIALTPKDQAAYTAQTKDALDNALRFDESNDLELMEAQIAITQKRWDNAAGYLKIVSDMAYDDPQVHSALLSMYKKMIPSGKPEITAAIKQENIWMANYEAKMKEAQKNQPAGTMPVRTQP